MFTISQKQRMTKTLREVRQMLKGQPAVGTTPGFAGWPRLKSETVQYMQESIDDLVILETSLNEDSDPVAIIYGLNAQSAWTVPSEWTT